MLEYLNSVFQRKHYSKTNRIDFLKPNFLYVDEFATFSPVLTDLFIQGRSFRVGTHIAVQNRTLLKICGEEDTINQAFIIESNTRNLIIFPGLNGDDADYYSKQFFNLHPSEIMYRPFGQIVYRIVQNRNIIPPDIGLTYFVDETPHADSIRNEYSFTEDGRIVYKDLDKNRNDDIADNFKAYLSDNLTEEIDYYDYDLEDEYTEEDDEIKFV